MKGTLGPFDYVNEINFGKKDLMADGTQVSEACYVPFIVNKSLSYFLDSVLFANEMNSRSSLDKKLQFHFLLNTIRPRRRFAKWHKSVDDVIELITEYYKCSHRIARQYASLLSEADIEEIKAKLFKGGSK